MTTQLHLYYAAERRAAQTNQTFLELVKDGMTKEDLATCIKRRPSLWGRFSGWLDKLPSRADAHSQTKLQFISTFRGVASYEVLGGPMDGMRIRAYYMSEHFYKADWNEGWGWAIDLPTYRRDVIDASGLVVALHRPVTADVLTAVQKDLGVEAGCELVSGLRHQRYVGQYQTGRYVNGLGWVREKALAGRASHAVA